MSRQTADRHVEMRASGERTPSTLRIDSEAFEALSLSDQFQSGDDLKILSWLETWSRGRP